MELLSIIVPCYNEEDMVPIFYQEMLFIMSSIEKLENLETELIFVNDGSKDSTLNLIKNLTLNDSRINYISFTKNFGKEAGILAGLKEAKGNYVVIMDVDLQDPPRLLLDMLRYIRQDNYDSVATRRVNRIGEPPIRSLFAKMFYKLINHMSDANIVDGARDYRMMTRQMVDSILELSEYHRFSKGIFGWIGYRTKWLEFENVERAAGQTKWSFWKLFRYAIEGIVAFSTVPLRLASIFGLMLSIISIIVTFIVIFKKLLFGDPVEGWASLMCVLLVISGIQFMFMGIIGEYLAKTYMEVKRRPNYFIKETNIDMAYKRRRHADIHQ